jgi:hypothetical protein
MNVIALETRIDYTYTTKTGVTLVISGVPVSVAREASGEEHQVFSMAVSMRLAELIKRVKNANANAGSSFQLEF